MKVAEAKKKTKHIGRRATQQMEELHTEPPISEKDEVKRAEERTQKRAEKNS